MTKQNQKGFGIVEGLLVVVVIGLLGFIGWYVLQANKAATPKSGESQSAAQKTTEKTPAEVPAGTLVTKSKDFSIIIPDGWNIDTDTKSDFAIAVGREDMTYKKGTPATINRVDIPGMGGPMGLSFTVRYTNTKDIAQDDPSTQNLGTIKSADGLEVKKTVFTETRTTGLTFDLGTKLYGYTLTKGEKTIHVAYIAPPNEPDGLAIIEESIKSIKFL